MKFRKLAKRAALIGVILLAVQMLTFFTFAPRLLEKKLLTGTVRDLSHHSDSAYVRDFFTTDCTVGDSWNYYTHHLHQNESELRKKLAVSYIVFQDDKDRRWDVPEEEEYGLVYHTWVQYRMPWFTGLFTAKQTEYLRIDNKFRYSRDSWYLWCLFFWVPTSEIFESYGICSPLPDPDAKGVKYINSQQSTTGFRK